MKQAFSDTVSRAPRLSPEAAVLDLHNVRKLIRHAKLVRLVDRPPSPVPALGPAIDTVLRRCLAVSPGENVLVIVDPGTRGIGEALREGARSLGAEAVLAEMDERATDGTEPPPVIAAALTAADVMIAPTTRSLSHTTARKRATDAGVRRATLPGVTEDMLARASSNSRAKDSRSQMNRRCSGRGGAPPNVA